MSEITPGLFFRGVPLYVDKPINEASPKWNRFRLSLSKIKQLRVHSSHWRITCNYQMDGLVTTDYVRAKISDFDLIDFRGLGICRRVEYVNVRGHSCSDCDVSWWQDNNQIFHHDSGAARCGFDSSPGAVPSEDNFGFYASVNPNFRCTKSGQESTTNYWLGLYLERNLFETLI